MKRASYMAYQDGYAFEECAQQPEGYKAEAPKPPPRVKHPPNEQ